VSNQSEQQRVAVTGASGLLGRALVPLLGQQGYQVIAGVHSTAVHVSDHVTTVSLDLLNADSIREFVRAAAADWLIHAAALTDVDGCEKEPSFAEAIHATATEHLMAAVGASSTRVLYISTDYIFDGFDGPYDEDATPAPISVYGRTKLAGERAVQAAGDQHTIIRAGSFLGVGSPQRPTFAESMLRRMRDEPPLVVPIDQRASVTPVDYLAAAIIEIGASGHNGIWHVPGTEIVSRYELASKIAQLFGLDAGVVRGVPYEEIKRPAARPLNGGLITRRTLTARPPTLDSALAQWKQVLLAHQDKTSAG
jgi:dTDP-4-dehydrorhamnose reductase